jgi:hypothetical protein
MIVMDAQSRDAASGAVSSKMPPGTTGSPMFAKVHRPRYATSLFTSSRDAAFISSSNCSTLALRVLNPHKAITPIPPPRAVGQIEREIPATVAAMHADFSPPQPTNEFTNASSVASNPSQGANGFGAQEN